MRFGWGCQVVRVDRVDRRRVKTRGRSCMGGSSVNRASSLDKIQTDIYFRSALKDYAATVVRCSG